MPRLPTSLRDLITPALDAAEERARIRGERWSVRALESAHGIANGTLGAIAKGKRRAVDGPTASRIAEALGLEAAAIFAAQAEGTVPELEQTPPISSGVVVREEHTAILDLAFDPASHLPSDLAAVQSMLRERAALVSPGIDAPQIVRRWLDAAARIRARGERADPSKIIAELTARVVHLEEAQRRPVHPLAKAVQGRKKQGREGWAPPGSPGARSQIRGKSRGVLGFFWPSCSRTAPINRTWQRD